MQSEYHAKTRPFHSATNRALFRRSLPVSVSEATPALSRYHGHTRQSIVESVLTDVYGCAHAFERGFVVYSDAAKREVLDVPAGLLAAHGAVSGQVACAMAEGALARSGADIALAVTGFAGPTDTGEEGLVHFACVRRGGDIRHREVRFNPLGRGAIRLACLTTAIEMFEEML